MTVRRLCWIEGSHQKWSQVMKKEGSAGCINSEKAIMVRLPNTAAKKPKTV